jgi:hypothetical protein
MTADLFGDANLGPPGFRYVPEAIERDEEVRLLSALAELPFEPFQFHQYTGLRRVVSFGFKYDYCAQRYATRILFRHFSKVSV